MTTSISEAVAEDFRQAKADFDRHMAARQGLSMLLRLATRAIERAAASGEVSSIAAVDTHIRRFLETSKRVDKAFRKLNHTRRSAGLSPLDTDGMDRDRRTIERLIRLYRRAKSAPVGDALKLGEEATRGIKIPPSAKKLMDAAKDGIDSGTGPGFAHAGTLSAIIAFAVATTVVKGRRRSMPETDEG